jgi:hypothetical protein
VHLRSVRHGLALPVLAALGLAGVLSCSGGSDTHSSTVQPPTDAGVPPVTTPPDPTLPDPPPAKPPAFAGLGNGAVVSGPVALTATVAAGTAQVQFVLDGATVATVSAAPFAATWDSFSVANGAHVFGIRALDGSGAATNSDPVQVNVSNHIKSVFVILLENHDWSSIKGSASAPYINKTLLSLGAHAESYMNVKGLHPSLPNYLWLESGVTQGVTDDAEPAKYRLSTTQHLVSLLAKAGLTWKSYQEDIPGTDCPLTAVKLYAPKHNPMVYFTDVTSGVDRNSANCISHVRPYTELARDLESNTVAAYNFITPNACNDMHDSCAPGDAIGNGDAWLSREVPKILASKAYKEGGALFVVFDESEGQDVPIGFIALSPLAKPGYSNQITYTHSSTLRSLQEIFGVAPLLGDAANATNLRDLFKSFP